MRYLGYRPKKNEVDDMIWEVISPASISASISAPVSASASASVPSISQTHSSPPPPPTPSSHSAPPATLCVLIPHPMMTWKVDENGDGAIDWEEFQLMCAARRPQSAQPSES